MRLYTSELVKKYKARTVVDHVSIDVNQGEIVGLLGPNGAGKTTTFYMIVGLIKPNEGRIFLEDDEGKVAELTKEPVYKRAQMGVGYLAQEASVFRRLSVEDNIRAVLEMTDFSKEYQAERRRDADRGVPPAEGAQEPGHPAFGRRTAPYGDRARGGDQPGVHPARRTLRRRRPHRRGGHPKSIVATLKNKNIGVIITDHNVDETLAITDRTYLLYEGKILKTGTAEELAADPDGSQASTSAKHFELQEAARPADPADEEPQGDSRRSSAGEETETRKLRRRGF